MARDPVVIDISIAASTTVVLLMSQDDNLSKITHDLHNDRFTASN